MGDGMGAEISGDESDAQPPGAVRSLRLRFLRVLRGKPPSPFTNGSCDLLRGDSIGVMERHDVRVLCGKVLRLKPRRDSELVNRGVDISAPQLIEPKVVADDMIVRLKITRSLVVKHRGVELTQLAPRITEHEHGHVG